MVYVVSMYVNLRLFVAQNCVLFRKFLVSLDSPRISPAHQQTGWLLQIVGLQNIMQEAAGKTSLYTIVKKTEVLFVWCGMGKANLHGNFPDKENVNIFNSCNSADTGYGGYLHYCRYANSQYPVK